MIPNVIVLYCVRELLPEAFGATGAVAFIVPSADTAETVHEETLDDVHATVRLLPAARLTESCAPFAVMSTESAGTGAAATFKTTVSEIVPPDAFVHVIVCVRVPMNALVRTAEPEPDG